MQIWLWHYIICAHCTCSNIATVVWQAVYVTLREAEDRSTAILPYWKIPILRAIVPRQQKVTKALNLINEILDTLIATCKVCIYLLLQTTNKCCQALSLSARWVPTYYNLAMGLLALTDGKSHIRVHFMTSVLLHAANGGGGRRSIRRWIYERSGSQYSSFFAGCWRWGLFFPCIPKFEIAIIEVVQFW